MRKTIYAKMTALPVGLCALAFAVTSCGSSEYKKFADNEGKQVASILRENDCLACHSENAPLPFYGNLPLIGPVVQADMKEAVHWWKPWRTGSPFQRLIWRRWRIRP